MCGLKREMTRDYLGTALFGALVGKVVLGRWFWCLVGGTGSRPVIFVLGRWFWVLVGKVVLGEVAM